MIWLVGQYATETDGNEGEGGPAGIAWWAPDVLRRVAKTFSTEVPFLLSAINLKVAYESIGTNCETTSFDSCSEITSPVRY